MNASRAQGALRARRTGRAGAERLLDGAPAGSAMGHDRLAELLTAAAAPGHAGELAGEDAAAAAFTTQHLFPTAEPARRAPAPRVPRRFPLGRLRGFRALGLAAACGGLGVALAAATGAFSGSVPAGSSTPAVRAPATGTRPGAPATAARPATSPGGTASPGAAASAPAGGVAPAISTQLSGLCTELAGRVAALNGDTGAAGQSLSASGLEQALASPAVRGPAVRRRRHG